MQLASASPKRSTSVRRPDPVVGRTRPARRDAVTVRDVAAPLVVIALLYVGFFKSIRSLDLLPVDLTLVCFVAVVLAVAANVLGRHRRIKLPLPAAALVALLIPATLYALTNPEALDKRLKLIIPLLAVVGVTTLVKSHRRQRIWVWLHVVVGVALVATSSIGADNATKLLSRVGSNTIAAGRASGVAIVVLLVLLLTRGGLPRLWLKLVALATLVWLAGALVSTGSRGPVLACAASVLVVTVFGPGRGRLLRIVGGIAAVGAGWLLLADATGVGATRITRSLQGRDSLTGSREDLWREALSLIPQYPLGIGWGNFWAVLPPSTRLDSGYVQYPHNVLLEVWLEAGWLAGTGTAILLLASLARLRRSSGSPYAAALFGIAVFFVLNAMVSGDLNDNRMMWAAVAIAWVGAEGGGERRTRGGGVRTGDQRGTLVPVRIKARTADSSPRDRTLESRAVRDQAELSQRLDE